MERRIILGVVGFALLALALGILLPPLLVEPTPPSNLPWQIEITPAGHTHVFGITLDETSLKAAENTLGKNAEITLFRSPQGDMNIEAYLDPVNLSGLAARIVLSVRLPEARMHQMYEQGVRISKLGSGASKVTLRPEDLEQVRETPVATLTYIPSINLSPELVEKRFGQPEQRVKERDSDVEHWLYPNLGLDIAISAREKEVLQYVNPSRFDQLLRPLKNTEQLPST